MEQVLIIVGSAIFGLLGISHLIYTHFTNKLHPTDASVIDTMKSCDLVLTRETSLWKAWIGFNSSHSLGAIFFAAIYIPLAVINFEVIEESLWFSWLPVLVGISYTLLARLYWFQIPFTGILMATVCFLSAAVFISL